MTSLFITILPYYVVQKDGLYIPYEFYQNKNSLSELHDISMPRIKDQLFLFIT
jgi:hypothetical protein